MPAVAVIPALVTALLPEGFAAAIGGGLLGAVGAAEAASATIIGATTVGEAIGGTIIGAGTGAIQAAITGTDVGRGALGGAVSGLATPIVGGAVGRALAPLGETAAGRVLTGAISKGVGSEVGGALGRVATGSQLEAALKGAAPGAIASGIFGGIGAAGKELGTPVDKGVSSIGQTALTQLIGGTGAFGGGTVSQATGAPYTPPAPQAAYQPASSAPTTTSAIPSPAFGGGPGVPIFGTEQQTRPTGTWGQKTLRQTDTDQTAQTGGAVS